MAFAQLKEAVASFHKPQEGFEIETYGGNFEDAVNEIQSFVGASFPLIFIDPTGWTGYPFNKIKPLFIRAKCEVLINFMYEFINRFSYSDDPDIVASLDPILGGPGWSTRLDLNSVVVPQLNSSFVIRLKQWGTVQHALTGPRSADIPRIPGSCGAQDGPFGRLGQR
jgi:three-Cys-motif partner protein